MNADKLKVTLAKHSAWIRGEKDGECANLSGVNLSGANLSKVNLSGANLSGANLSGACLFGANLSGVNLSGANLSGANLSGAYLSGVNLSGACLFGAYLSGAYLSKVNLSGANLSKVNLSGACLSGAYLPREMPIEDWCNAHDLATLPDGRRVAFKRLDKSMLTGRSYGQTTKWARRFYVEAKDWNDAQKCGGGLHLSPTPTATRIYSDGEVCVPVAFKLSDAVHIGDKLKVRKCQVL